MWLNIVCTADRGRRAWSSSSRSASATGARRPARDCRPAGRRRSSAADRASNGAVLTFFSFIGFEDMLNVAEEVKNPQRNMPIGLIWRMVAATVIYMAVSITAVSVVPWRELARRPAPLVEVVRARRAVVPAAGSSPSSPSSRSRNTALLNYMMGSRLLYGMARQGLLPAPLGRVHAGAADAARRDRRAAGDRSPASCSSATSRSSPPRRCSCSLSVSGARARQWSGIDGCGSLLLISHHHT